MMRMQEGLEGDAAGIAGIPIEAPEVTALRAIEGREGTVVSRGNLYFNLPGTAEYGATSDNKPGANRYAVEGVITDPDRKAVTGVILKGEPGQSILGMHAGINDPHLRLTGWTEKNLSN